MNNNTKFCVCRQRSVASDQCYGCEPEEDDADFKCPVCRGGGSVNPLTAPKGFFCTGTTDCPACDGSGEI
jgi:DnaJ-class molecular chaperone